MIRLKESLVHNGYMFQNLIPNEFENPGDIMMDKLKDILTES